MIQARENRFIKIINYCKKNNIFHLFIGHHYDDNIETFMLRKIAGSNFEGLNCMQEKTIYKDIRNTINNLNIKEIKQFNLVDIYTDEKLGDDESLTIKFILQSEDKTLEESDITEIMNKILSSLKEELSIGIR